MNLQEMFLKEEEDQSLAVILSIICMVVTIIAVFTFGVLPTNEFVFMFFVFCLQIFYIYGELRQRQALKLC